MQMEDVLTPSLASFVVACACSTLGMMVSLSFAIFHVYHRNNRVVKMSSPFLNLLISFGATLLSVSCFLFGLDFIIEGNLSGLSALCQTRAWLIACSASIIFGPVVAKTWRVYQIFKYGAVKRVVIKDSRLFLISLCIVIIDIIIMSVWQIIDPFVMQHTSFVILTLMPTDAPFPKNISTVLQECDCKRFPLWITILCLWKLVLIIQVLVLAWKIRNVSVPTLNDSSSIMAAVFGTLLITFVILLTSSAFKNQPAALYMNITILVSTGSIWIQTILFLPKIHYWWKNTTESHFRISTTSIKDTDGVNDANSHIVSNVDGQISADVNGNSLEEDGILEIVEENKALKQSLLEKQEYIGTLQKHLDRAKEKISALPDDLIEIKQDSGLDLELSGTDDKHNDNNIYETLRSPERSRRLDRSTIYRVDGLSPSEDTDFESIDDIDHSKQGTKLKYCPSIRSWTSRRSFVEEFTDLRDTLEAELSTVQAINSELKDSCEKDYQRSYSETEWLYERRNAEDLADSITKSYDLDDNRETLSYINSYIPKENNVYQVRSRKSVISVNSSETFSQTSFEVESSTVQNDLPSSNRENSTPNSQQHAAILRYYSYRHMNDKFNKYMAGRKSMHTRETCYPRVVLTDEVFRNGDVLGTHGKSVNKAGIWKAPTDSFV